MKPVLEHYGVPGGLSPSRCVPSGDTPIAVSTAPTLLSHMTCLQTAPVEETLPQCPTSHRPDTRDPTATSDTKQTTFHYVASTYHDTAALMDRSADGFVTNICETLPPSSHDPGQGEHLDRCIPFMWQPSLWRLVLQFPAATNCRKTSVVQHSLEAADTFTVHDRYTMALMAEPTRDRETQLSHVTRINHLYHSFSGCSGRLTESVEKIVESENSVVESDIT